MSAAFSSAVIRQAAAIALADRFGTLRPDVPLSAAGYVPAFRDNLLPGVDPADFEADLRAGDGNELESKFRAVHSSSALAVNAFAPFRRRPGDLRLGGRDGFEALGFEHKCPTGLRGGRSPNLDLVAEGESGVVAVESKCLEFLAPKPAKFAPAYLEQIRDARRDGPWFAEMRRCLERPEARRFLDVAQLVKHAFGLTRVFADRPVTLLYLYWEPEDAGDFPVFAEHRAEIAGLAERVAGGTPAFAAISYPKLWTAWDAAAGTGWLGAHVAALRARYLVALGHPGAGPTA